MPNSSFGELNDTQLLSKNNTFSHSNYLFHYISQDNIIYLCITGNTNAVPSTHLCIKATEVIFFFFFQTTDSIVQWPFSFWTLFRANFAISFVTGHRQPCPTVLTQNSGTGLSIFSTRTGNCQSNRRMYR
jgi:hypothetical protein